MSLITYNKLMCSSRRLLSLLILLFFPMSNVSAQNEAQFKAMTGRERFIPISKTDPDSSKETVSKEIRSFSNYYRLDLNGDGFLEGIGIENSDQGSSIHFFRNFFEHFQELKVASGGTFSSIDKIEIKKISNRENVMLIYYSEGLSKYLVTRSRQRLYTIYIPEFLFKKKFKIRRGPVIFEEFSNRGHYHVRKKEVLVDDLNKDGVKEILIKNRNSVKVLMLNSNDEFITI